VKAEEGYEEAEEHFEYLGVYQVKPAVYQAVAFALNHCFLVE